VLHKMLRFSFFFVVKPWCVLCCTTQQCFYNLILFDSQNLIEQIFLYNSCVSKLLYFSGILPYHLLEDWKRCIYKWTQYVDLWNIVACIPKLATTCQLNNMTFFFSMFYLGLNPSNIEERFLGHIVNNSMHSNRLPKDWNLKEIAL
jgi:hypothetical protein